MAHVGPQRHKKKTITAYCAIVLRLSTAFGQCRIRGQYFVVTFKEDKYKFERIVE